MRGIVVTVLAGGIAGALGSFIVLNTYHPSEEKLREDFYLIENAVLVSPHGLRKKMAHGETSFVLVDLRSQDEYEREHIAGAISIPAYADPNTSAYDDVERIVNAFSELPKYKDVIVYCYSGPCMTGRKVGKMLAEHGIYVKHLGIGWNEWRHHWNTWNHEHEWSQTDVEDYLATGPEPGSPVIDQDYISPCVPGVFEC